MRPEDTGLRDALNNAIEKAEGTNGLETEWFVHGESLGTSPTKMTHSHNTDHVPYSILYVCQNCGDPWGKIVVKSANSRWIPIRRQCENCGPGVLGYRDDDIYEMPMAAGMREIPLMRKCKDYEIHLITGGD